MKAIVKILRAIVVMLSFGALIGYYIITSDVPPTVQQNELYIFVIVYFCSVLVSVADFIICIKHRYRRGYFTLCMECITLVLWILTCHGVNWHITDNQSIFSIILGGIISAIVLVLLQLPQAKPKDDI